MTRTEARISDGKCGKIGNVGSRDSKTEIPVNTVRLEGIKLSGSSIITVNAEMKVTQTIPVQEARLHSVRLPRERRIQRHGCLSVLLTGPSE
jgi:hypothetical protein